MRVLVLGATPPSHSVIEEALSAVARIDFVPDTAAALRRLAGAHVQGDHFQLLCIESHDGGHEMLSCLRNWEADMGVSSPLPVLTITENPDVDHITQQLRSCRSYLIQPFTAQQLLERLASLDLVELTVVANTNQKVAS